MGKYLRISYHTAGKTIPLFNLLLRYKIFLNYFMAFGILAILRHHREIINISWWHVISWCTAFYFLRTTGYFLRTTGKRDTSSPSNNKFQACKAKENISAKLRQNIGQESLLIAALSTLFKPRVFDLILEQILKVHACFIYDTRIFYVKAWIWVRTVYRLPLEKWTLLARFVVLPSLFICFNIPANPSRWRQLSSF